MDLEEAVVVKTFLNLSEVDLAAAELHSAGIECAISSDDAGGAYPSLALIKLLVDPAHCDQARQILNELPVVESSQQPIQPETPPALPKPIVPPPPFAKFGWGLLVGAGVGALLHWCYIKGEQFGRHTYQFDNDQDGVMDEEHIWRDGESTEFRRDRNGDGRIDYRTYYENNVPKRDELDDNFDGQTDAWYTYSPRGIYSLLRFDTDTNGVVDAVTTFKSGMAVQTDWQPNGTNIITLRQIYANGVLKEELRDTDGDGRFDVSVHFDSFSTPVHTNWMLLLTKPHTQP